MSFPCNVISKFKHTSFWDTEEETLVIATHGIVKKTQKTPLKEITKAEEIRVYAESLSSDPISGNWAGWTTGR